MAEFVKKGQKAQICSLSCSSRNKREGLQSFNRLSPNGNLSPLELNNKAEHLSAEKEGLSSSEEIIDQLSNSFVNLHSGHDFSRVRVHPNPKAIPTASFPCFQPIQAKLAVSQPDDIYEQEADRIAEHVMRMTEPRIVNRSEITQPLLMQRSCPKCKKKATERQDQERLLQMRPASGAGPKGRVALGSSVPPIVHKVLRSPGQLLDHATRCS